MLKRFGLAVMTLALVGALAGGAAAQQALTWTAGAVGGGWYTISGGMAELLREKTGLNIKVVPGGGTQNPVLVEKGEADLGMGLPRCSAPPSAARTRTRGRRWTSSARSPAT